MSLEDSTPKPRPHRRRKKARLGLVVDRTGAEPKASRDRFPDFTDNATSPLWGNDVDESRSKKFSRILPVLLAKREVGAYGGFRKRIFCSVALLEHECSENILSQPRRRWRSFALQKIPFTKLSTPRTDAVLALNRSGNILLSLGEDSNHSMILRFYATPSPGMLQRSSYLHSYSASRLLSVPLIRRIPEETEESMEESIFNFRRQLTAANTPVKILISKDWVIGAVLILAGGSSSVSLLPISNWIRIILPETNTSQESNDEVGSVTVFDLTRGAVGSAMDRIFMCSKVRVCPSGPFTLRNLLWRVAQVPVLDDKQPKSDWGVCRVYNAPAHLFFNDEDDGYRITWFFFDSLRDYSFYELEPPHQDFVSSDCMTTQQTWEVPGRGLVKCPMTERGPTLVEVFLNVEVLLGELLMRRKRVADKYREYHYNLVSVSGQGRYAEVVVAFIASNRPGSLAVFLLVDLYKSAYREGEWVQGKADFSSLRHWCNALALNRRMRSLHAGPYSIPAGRKKDWRRLCREEGPGLDAEDDFDPHFWSDFLHSMGSRSSKRIGMASLYPDCDLVTNDAVIAKLPVPELLCSDAPSKIVYG